jgi:hypothetical protein
VFAPKSKPLRSLGMARSWCCCILSPTTDLEAHFFVSNAAVYPGRFAIERVDRDHHPKDGVTAKGADESCFFNMPEHKANKKCKKHIICP